MAKTVWQMGDTVLPADMNEIGGEINGKSIIMVSDIEPVGKDNLYWYQDIGETATIGSISGKITRENANFGRLASDFSDFILWYGLVEQDTDPDHVMTGKSSLKISVDSGPNTTSAAQLRFVNYNFSKTKNLLIRFYAPVLDNLSKFQVRFSNVDGMTNYLQWEQSRWKMVPGWNEILIPMSQLTAVGTANQTFLENVKTIQVSVTGSGSAYIDFDAIYMNHVQDANVIFHFDDGWESQFTKAFPILSQHGYIGNIGVISGSVGTNGYMTLDQLKRLNEYGWDLFNHTNTHADLSTLTEDQVRNELLTCRQYLDSNGFGRASDIVAYPYGNYNQTVLQVMQEQNFRLGRSVMEDIEVVPPIQPYILKMLSIYNDTTDSVYQDVVDRIAETGGTVIILLHRIEDSGTDSSIYPTAKFVQLVDYVFNKSGVNVISITEWANQFS